jgi:hypothetical protein
MILIRSWKKKKIYPSVEEKRTEPNFCLMEGTFYEKSMKLKIRNSEVPDLHLERARDRVDSSRTAWCTDYWWGESPGQGVVVEKVLEVK